MILTTAQCERLFRLMRSVEHDAAEAEADFLQEPTVRLGPAADGGIVAVVAVQIHGLPEVKFRPARIARDGQMLR